MNDAEFETGFETGFEYSTTVGNEPSTPAASSHPGASKRVTLAEVAAHAGVSKSQASKAINQEYGVNPRTRERVLASAEELGFVPDAVARSLTIGRSETVGLLTHDLEGRGFAIPIMLGAERALRDDTASILLSNTGGDPATEVRKAQSLVSRRVDALLLVGDRSDPRPPLALAAGVPVVYAYAPSLDPADHSVAPDDRGGGRMAAQHLLDIGRRRIGYVGGRESYAANRDRIDGVRSVLAAAGLDLVNDPRQTGWDDDAGWAETIALLDEGVDVDALVCASDTVGRGALDALRSRGVAVPEDVALVSFDNLDLVSATTRPGLTSVDLNLTRLGEVAAQTILALHEGVGEPGVVHAPCTLVIRGSTSG